MEPRPLAVIPPACSSAPARAAAAGSAVLATSPSSPLRPKPLPGGGSRSPVSPGRTAAQARGKLRGVLRGWCIVVFPARQSGPTRFCRGAADGRLTVVSCLSETSGFRSPSCFDFCACVYVKRNIPSPRGKGLMGRKVGRFGGVL